MSTRLRVLRLAALNIDGVLLNDTFSPVIHRFVVSRGGAYTAEVERRVFSQPRAVAGARMAEAVTEPMTGDEALAAYFADREAYLAEHPVRLEDGAVELLSLLRRLGLQTVCYGGLGKEHFDEYLGEHAASFDGPGYVCTDGFRPGIREITEEFGVSHDQALFIDDVTTVAEEARRLDVPFIGFPSDFEKSFQRRLMEEAGVRHLVGSLGSVDEALIRTLDEEAGRHAVWTD
ncbi:HAD family phosphatase [Streptomyces sp. JNUCC 64]